MDPQHRMLLEAAFECTRTCADGALGQTSVSVGIQQMEYANLMGKWMRTLSPYMATGSALSVAAGRISYTYGLSGSSMSVDTACSASLVALHVARGELLRSSAQSSLAGGVNLILSEVTMSAIQRASMLAVDGRCKVLDSRADGYVREAHRRAHSGPGPAPREWGRRA